MTGPASDRARPRGPKPTDEPGSRTAAYRVAIRLLEHRDRTVADLRTRLTDRGFEPEVIEDTLARLRADRFVDDARYAERYTSSMRELRGYGTRRIRLELTKRGVDPDLVTAATQTDRGGERETAEALARKRARSLPAGLSREQALRRLAGYLGRKGYEAEVVWTAAKRALEPPG